MKHKKNIEMSADDVLAMKKWSRENFVSLVERNPNWHPVILEEMKCIEVEMNRNRDPFQIKQIVPLENSEFSQTIGLHAPHETMNGPRILDAERVSSENYIG